MCTVYVSVHSLHGLGLDQDCFFVVVVFLQYVIQDTESQMKNRNRQKMALVRVESVIPALVIYLYIVYLQLYLIY